MGASDMMISILASIIIGAAPILFACIGEIFSQRAGVMNLGLEGIMLIGAVVGYYTGYKTGSMLAAILAVIVVGAAVGIGYAFLTVKLKANQVVAGLALVTFGTGVSGFVGMSVVSVASQYRLKAIAIPLLSKIPVIGEVLFNQDPLVYFLYFLVPLATVYMMKTKPGLVLRSLGENPGALDADGYNVIGLRYAYVTLGCILTAIGGAYITLVSTPFWNDEMTSGKGWIAAALVIFSMWNPVIAIGGSLLFSGVNVLTNYIPLFLPNVPTYFLKMLPYACTIIVLILSTGSFRHKHTAQPAMLCVPYDREER
ncbi:MAG: ABC transporter permease [Candidatus Metalachnospira sp.]|nr:ABC transporter permease [Candidatus Metalachnospira sp.]